MSRLKIAWVTPYPIHTLGDEWGWVRRRRTHPNSWVVNLARVLGQRQDIELHLLTLCPWVKADKAMAHPDGYTLHLLLGGIPFLHRGFPAYLPLDALTHYRRERHTLVCQLRRLQPDVVHAHGTEYAYGLAAMDAGYPWVVSLQGIIAEYGRTHPCLLYRLVAPLESQVLKQAAFVGGRTHFDKGHASGVNPKATILDMPEAVHECFYDAPWKDPHNWRILFVGSCEQRKGLHHLIAALGILARQFPDLRLDVCGSRSPKQQAPMQAQAAKNGVSLTFLGFKNAPEIATLHRECCLFVLPSENENSPNVLAEAMASGMPVVAFNTGGVSSMVDPDVSGLLVPCGDVEGLARSIARLLLDPADRQRLGKSARAQSARNRPEQVAETTVQAYRRILAEWQPRGRGPDERSRIQTMHIS